MKTRVFYLIAVTCTLFFSACFHQHQWMAATCTQPRTCEECGELDGDAIGHLWLEATCTETKRCSLCDAAEGKPLGHDWNEATCDSPKTCGRCAEMEGDIAHVWEDASCVLPETCASCGETRGEPIAHLWQDATVKRAKTCFACGLTDGEPLPVSYFDMSFAEYRKAFNREYSGIMSMKKTSSGFKIELAGGSSMNIVVFNVDKFGSDVGASYSSVEHEKFNALQVRLLNGYATYSSDDAFLMFQIGSLAAVILDQSMTPERILNAMTLNESENGLTGSGSYNGFDFYYHVYEPYPNANKLWYEFSVELSANAG